jgi:hypothetical protein
MKNIVRCLAIALAVTGMIATTSAKTSLAATKTSAHPVPTCAPGDGDCGLSQW